MNPQNITDLAIVLSRTNYQERDRILTILTLEHGKLHALAKGVRASKSKLAGGIELFAENELTLIKGRGDLYTLISSRMKFFWGDITKDLDKSAYAYQCLKNVNKLTQDEAGTEYYPYVKELLAQLNDKKIDFTQLKVWFGLKLLNCLGVTPNFKTMANDELLSPNEKYQFDFDKQCFFVKPDGQYSSDHVKILRTFSQAAKPIQINGCKEEVIDSTDRLINLLLQEHIS